MDQDTRWLIRYNEVMDFMKKNNRNPSRHRIGEHNHLNWIKAYSKLMNAGALKDERLVKVKGLLALSEQYKRKNQYQ